MTRTRWGIAGPGRIARNFVTGLGQTDTGVLVAVASRDAERSREFGTACGVDEGRCYAGYDTLLQDPEVDAVYISTPHPFHAGIAVAAMRAGKHVLCEKPAGMTAAQVTAITEVAAQEGVFFMEAFMYRCHPQIARLVEIVRSGEIGEVRYIGAAFGFAAPFDPASRLFDRALGGGGILDVGGYPVSLARLVAGAAAGKPFANPSEVRAVGVIGETSVDVEAHALMRFASGVIASCAVSVRRRIGNSATITGSKGEIRLPNPFVPGRNAGPSDATIEIEVDGAARSETIRRPEQLFFFEADVASRAIAAGRQEPDHPAVGWADSIGNATVLDQWRRGVGYTFTPADVSITRRLSGLIPPHATKVPRRRIDGVDREVSQLIMGCDNRDFFADGAIVWDAWMEAGGNAFDTAFTYGGGRHETVLGEWIQARGLAGEIVVVAKGGHTPNCAPETLAPQLAISLERLRLDKVPIFIMHRDNPEVAAGEFVDALNRLHQRGLIGIFGGSNWTPERVDEANAYAADHGLMPFRILNNNLSLAVMERPVWPGCESSNTPATLAWLKANGMTHLSWSSQARGFFHPGDLRDRLPAASGPDRSFGSDANEERRRRAETVAASRGVATHNIATAWVLAQPFPSFALIGPRSPGEIASTLPALDVNLTPSEVAWLNLETDEEPQ